MHFPRGLIFFFNLIHMGYNFTNKMLRNRNRQVRYTITKVQLQSVSKSSNA